LLRYSFIIFEQGSATVICFKFFRLSGGSWKKVQLRDDERSAMPLEVQILHWQLHQLSWLDALCVG